MPMVEKLGLTMTHATSTFAFPLAHSVIPDDLKCSDELWATDPNNLAAGDRVKRPQRLWMHAAQAIHRSLTPAASSLSTGTLHSFPIWDPIIEWLAWHFQSALVTLSAPFDSMCMKLGMPESQLQIPVMKTLQVPC